MKKYLIVLATWMTVAPYGLWAQDRLEEVVVTAGFRDRALMDTAGSATVIDAARQRDRAAQHLESVLDMVPNVAFSSGGSRARFVQVRGIGDLEQFVDPKHFPSVGIAIDDISLGGTANAAMLFDTDQVEILRGPQGTRFGSSALAGLVNIRGNRPGDSFEAYAQTGFADYGAWNVGAVVSGPLNEVIGARLAVQKNQGDGYIDNSFLDRDDTNGYDETTLRATVDIHPNSDATYGLTMLYFDGANGYDAFSLDNTRETLSDQPGHDTQQILGLSGRGEWQIGEAIGLHAVASWVDSDLEYGFDEDWSFVGICDGTLCDPVFDFFSNTDNYLRDRSEFSVDVRLLGDRSVFNRSGFEYVIGVYLQSREEDLHRQYFGDFFSAYETDRRAVYGQLRFDPADKLTFSAGFRYEEFDDAYTDSFGLQSATNDSLSGGEVSVTYQLSDRTALYATIARGNKAGGFNTGAGANLPFMQPVFRSFMQSRLNVQKETLLNREVGLKAMYLDGRLSLRTALFHMDRENAQLESWLWDGQNFLWVGFLDNVEASNWGAELELDFELSDRIALFASAGNLESEVDAITTFDLDRGDFVAKNDVEQAKSPGWQFNVGTSVNLPHGWAMRLEVAGRDDSRFGYYHDQTIGAYTLVNASVRRSIGRAELQIWGRNLTDKDYAVHGLYFGNDPRKGWVNETYFQFGEPRVVGVSVRFAL